MVLIDLKEIFQYSPVFEDSYTVNSSELNFPADAGELRGPVEVDIRIEKGREGYRVSLKIHAKVDLECSRCLSPFTREMNIETEKQIERPPLAENLELSSSDLEVSFIEDELLILEDLVREEILLNLSMKPLCSPDCRGILPGMILEEGENTAKRDPRFAILKNLLD
jgi:uncharacterized protein